ncbi:MAG: Mur ligase family protein, partial [Chitinophagales bacterium]|nr:Mur ligase family protein [Chitinophagales bacterium]
MSLTFSQTLNFLWYTLPNFSTQGKVGMKYDLTNIQSFLSYLHNPHTSLKCIHVAGTNGKGSVTHLLAAYLGLHGFKVGIYSSPHVVEFGERIKIGREFIEEDFVVEFVEKHQDFMLTQKLSYFEAIFGMAMAYFKEKSVDYCVVEVGLGGLLDTTNIIVSTFNIITNISFDHQDVLGNTLQAIASQKAGIIKENAVVLIGEKQEEVVSVYQEVCQKQHAELNFSEDLVRYEYIEKESMYLYDTLNQDIKISKEVL